MSSFSALALKPVEQLLNRGIGLSSTAGAMAAALDGQTLGIQVDGTPLVLQLRAGNGRLELTTTKAESGTEMGSYADARVAGSPLALLRLLGSDPEALIRDGEIRMTGDTDVADRFRDLLHMAKPDLEEELSKLVGDPLAHRVGLVGREFADFGRRTLDSVSRSTGEYFTEERRTLPTQFEAGEFYGEVDTLVDDVERAAARLARLKEHPT